MKTPSIRNILVPIDFSKMSISAIGTAKRLAQQFGATVHLAHVRQFFYAGFSAPMSPLVPFSVPTYDPEAEKIAKRRLCELAAKHGLSAAICHISTGAPVFDELCRLARQIPAELIVTPTHGHTGLKHVFLGSTAERLVQHSPCPVLVTRSGERQPRSGAHASINRILVPVDFSGCSLAGLKYAIRFANTFGASIVLLHVVDLGLLLTADGYRIYDLETYRTIALKEATNQMREFVRLAKFGRVKFKTTVQSGLSVQQITDFAQGNAIDLIITATHGFTGFKHVLIGSTAEHIVRHAPCPVLVVPSHPGVRSAQSKTRPAKSQPRGKDRVALQSPPEPNAFTRKYRKLRRHPFPERRKTNKFREGHLVS